MQFIDTYPVCKDCKHSTTLYCNKYNSECISFKSNTQRYEIPCAECLEKDGYEQKDIFALEDTTITDNIAYFHIPDLFQLKYIIKLKELQKKYPNCFYSNRKILEVYGAFAGCLWNGRSPLFGEPFLSIQEINQIKHLLESNGIFINLTWNNHLIKDSQLLDTYCNIITELFHTGQHSITVSSQELYKYLKEKFPNYKYYQSIIKPEEKDITKIFDNDFDIILLPRILNNNWEILKTIPTEDKKRVEFLCNDNCSPFCTYMNHYNIINKCLSNFAYESTIYSNHCQLDNEFLMYNTRHWPITINSENIDQYINEGFSHFKLCSRGDNPIVLIYKLCQYLVKPEYFEDIYFNILLKGTAANVGTNN